MATMTILPVERPPAGLWSWGFRPFFLACALWAVLALAAWIDLYLSGGALPSRFDPLSWHIHEMLFGVVMAAIAGFMLTAIPNWTRRAPVHDGRLAALAGLWLIGRVACLFSAALPLWLAAAIDLAFPVAICIVSTRELVAARNWRNLAMPIPVAVLGAANLLMYLELAGRAIPAGLGWRLAMLAALALVSAVGGRIIPAFTRNWLAPRNAASLPPPHGALDRVALASLHTGLLGWVFFPDAKPVGVILLAAAGLVLWQLARWRGLKTLAEPMVTILHLGYAWLAIGAALLGASLLGPAVPPSAAIHAFTVGAMSTMVLGVMTRATRGHTGRALNADRATAAIYLLIFIASVTRVLAACLTDLSVRLLSVSAALWIASFALFVLRYAAMLVGPERRRA